jgi:Fur family ferric uptake transcriptional regulator
LVSDHLSHKGQRFTDRRRLILEKLYVSKQHLSVDELLLLVRGDDPRVSYATVYRLLRVLCETGAVAEHHFGDGFARYEVAEGVKHHDHLVCLDCGAVMEFEEPIIEELQERVARSRGFELEAHRLELYVRCRKQDCENLAALRRERRPAGVKMIPGLRVPEAAKH